MAKTFPNLVLNNLEEFDFIGGQDEVLTFEVYSGSGVSASPTDLSGCTLSWVAAPYGNPQYAILNIAGVSSGSYPGNIFTVTITGSSTANLSGRYTQQPIIIDISGQEFRPGQGSFIINSKIGA
jgi:hypothetical protein